MRTFFNIRVLAASATLAVCVAIGAPTASASNGCYSPHCYYKTVTVYETVRRPVTYFVTKYDHCGKPYRVKRVAWKTVRVPVTKRVKVCY